jgi:hypothetical protein
MVNDVKLFFGQNWPKKFNSWHVICHDVKKKRIHDSIIWGFYFYFYDDMALYLMPH